MEHKCFTDPEGKCAYCHQGTECVLCNAPNAVLFSKLQESCKRCGRLPGIEEGGCAACLGRAWYIYPCSYEECDCGSYKTNGMQK